MLRKQSLTITLPAEILTAVKELAAAEERSIAKTVEMLLREAIEARVHCEVQRANP